MMQSKLVHLLLRHIHPESTDHVLQLLFPQLLRVMCEITPLSSIAKTKSLHRFSENYTRTSPMLYGTSICVVNFHRIITRKADRISIGRRSDYQIEALLAESKGRPLSAYVVSPGRDFLEHDVPQHAGQELLFVLKGRIEVSVADQQFTLAAGDGATYDAALRHKLRRLGSAAADVLVVIGQL